MKLSLEVFPPKISDGIDHIYGCLDYFSTLKSEFISVTYSAGNASKGLTKEVCYCIKSKYGVKPVSHLTCAGATKESIKDELIMLKSLNVDTVLALRGDLVSGKKIIDLPHSTDLIELINAFGGFEVFAACYPEGHVEDGSYYDNISVLKQKYNLGVKHFLSQLFFDNNDFLRLRDTAKKISPEATLHAGIMPVFGFKSVIRMKNLSGAKIPKEMEKLLNTYGNDKVAIKKAGVEYATKQIENLHKEGCEAVHLYTMDSVSVTKEIYEGIKGFIE